MGFRLLETMATDETVEYWNIHDVFISRVDGRMDVTLFGYNSKETRDKEGGMQITRKTLQIPYVEPFEVPVDSTIEAEIYKLLKLTDAFKDAEDVL